MKLLVTALSLLMTISAFAEVISGKPSSGKNFEVMGESFLYDPEMGSENKAIKKAAALESAEDLVEVSCFKEGMNTEILSSTMMVIFEEAEEGTEAAKKSTSSTRHYLAIVTAKCSK